MAAFNRILRDENHVSLQMKVPKEIQKIKKLIRTWNDEHQEIYKIEGPDKDHNFRGVIKLFYFNNFNEIQTRCLKIDNLTTTRDVIDMFIQKCDNEEDKTPEQYSLFSVYPNGEYVRLSDSDNPLLVLLSWVESNLDGRLLLKNYYLGQKLINSLNSTRFMTFDRRSSSSRNNTQVYIPLKDNIESNIKDLYASVPVTPTNAGISKHEEVLKRQRQKKLSNKIKEFMEYELMHGNKNPDFGGEDGPKLGTLKIFVSSILPENPYKTIMVSIYDSARSVVKEIIDKMKAFKVQISEDECFLTMIITSNVDKQCGKHLKAQQREYCILDDDYPLLLSNKYLSQGAKIQFHLRRKICDDLATNYRIHEEAKKFMLEKKYFAIFCQLIVLESKVPPDHPTFIALNRDVIAIGRNSYCLKESTMLGQKPTEIVVLKHYSIHPIHCVISGLNGILSVTPSVLEADVRIDGAQIYETTTLLNGNVLSLGCSYYFKIFIPTKISAETSQIYWKTFHSQDSAPTIHKPPTKTHKIPNFQEESSLPLYFRFTKSTFQAIIEKLLNLLFDIKIKFKPAIGYLIYLAFIAQFENFSKKNEAQKELPNLLKSYRTFCKSASKIMDETIIYNNQSTEILLMWLSNISEFLNFLRHDIFLQPITEEVRNLCEHCVRVLVNQITRKFESEILHVIESLYSSVMPSKCALQELDAIINFDPTAKIEEADRNELESSSNNLLKRSYVQKLMASGRLPIFSDVLQCFNDWLSMFCLFQINPSFTVQMYQRIFDFMCKYVIDHILLSNDTKSYINMNEIESLRVSFNFLLLWAESQGMEMVINKSFLPLMQLFDYITTPIDSLDKFLESIAMCDSFNSLQMETLTLRCEHVHKQLKSQPEWRKAAIDHARKMNDFKNNQVGNSKLEFKRSQIKPCFITDDGYTVESPQEITNILYKILRDLNISDIQIIKSQENLLHWNCRFTEIFDESRNTDKKAEYMFLTFEKDPSTCLGMRILAIKNSRTGNQGIYICRIEPNTQIHKDGRLAKGDQLISVNDKSLIGVGEKQAVDIISSSGNKLKFEVLKNSAQLHGLFHLLDNSKEGFNTTSEKNSDVICPKNLSSNQELSILVDLNTNKVVSEDPLKMPLKSSELESHKNVNYTKIISHNESPGNPIQCAKAIDEVKITREKEYNSLLKLFLMGRTNSKKNIDNSSDTSSSGSREKLSKCARNTKKTIINPPSYKFYTLQSDMDRSKDDYC